MPYIHFEYNLNDTLSFKSEVGKYNIYFEYDYFASDNTIQYKIKKKTKTYLFDLLKEYNIDYRNLLKKYYKILSGTVIEGDKEIKKDFLYIPTKEPKIFSEFSERIYLNEKGQELKDIRNCYFVNDVNSLIIEKIYLKTFLGNDLLKNSKKENIHTFYNGSIISSRILDLNAYSVKSQFYFKNLAESIIGISDENGAINDLLFYDLSGTPSRKIEDLNFLQRGKYYDKELDQYFENGIFRNPDTLSFFGRSNKEFVRKEFELNEGKFLDLFSEYEASFLDLSSSSDLSLRLLYNKKKFPTEEDRFELKTPQARGPIYGLCKTLGDYVLECYWTGPVPQALTVTLNLSDKTVPINIPVTGTISIQNMPLGAYISLKFEKDDSFQKGDVILDCAGSIGCTKNSSHELYFQQNGTMNFTVTGYENSDVIDNLKLQAYFINSLGEQYLLSQTFERFVVKTYPKCIEAIATSIWGNYTYNIGILFSIESENGNPSHISDKDIWLQRVEIGNALTCLASSIPMLCDSLGCYEYCYEGALFPTDFYMCPHYCYNCLSPISLINYEIEDFIPSATVYKINETEIRMQDVTTNTPLLTCDFWYWNPDTQKYEYSFSEGNCISRWIYNGYEVYFFDGMYLFEIPNICNGSSEPERFYYSFEDVIYDWEKYLDLWEREVYMGTYKFYIAFNPSCP